MANFKYPNNYDDDFINTFKKVLDYLNEMGYTYEESLQKAQDILDEAQRTNNMNESVQQQINTLIAESGTSDAEVLQARVDAEGNEFPVLKDRLDNSDDKISRTSGQPDFIRKLKDFMKFDELHIKKVTDRLFSVINYNKATGRHLTNVFQKNANDDYIILSESYVGEVTFNEFSHQYVNYELLSGAMDTQYANHYATEVGTLVKGEIEGNVIIFRRNSDSRGGVWEFTIDGDLANKVRVSTYHATQRHDYVTLAENLSDGLHVVVGEFLGDDPENPPSTGAGTSRGYMMQSQTVNSSKAFHSRVYNLNNVREKNINVAASNKDFALRVRKAGSSGTYEFVPEHNSTGTAFALSPPQFLLDGKHVDIFNLDAGITVKGKEFSIVQSVEGRYPTTNEALVRVDTVQKITLDGLVRIIGKVRALADIEISDGYFLMLPVTSETATQMKSSLYNTYNTEIYDGSKTYLTEEKDTTTSFVFTSSNNPSLFSAITFNDPKRTLRMGEEMKYDEGRTAWIEHRNTSMQKLYQSVFRLANISAGEEFYFDGSILSGETSNVHLII